jgi:4-hydroxy-4-methyl-2-oxoglutarate aldolase
VSHSGLCAGEEERVAVSLLTPELVARFRRLDGAAVSNAIETFEVRLRNEGFADSTLRCQFPDLPAVVGHAVTARIRCSAPPPVGHSYHDRTDWWNYIVSVPAPRIVVVQDVDARAGLGAFVGDVHAQILHALGCVAYATNGSVRDLADVRTLGFQFFAPTVAVSHAFAHIVDFGNPVEVGGLAVSTGDVLFGDCNGLLSVPPELLSGIPDAIDRLEAKEAHVIALCRSPRFSIEGLRTLVKDLG